MLHAGGGSRFFHNDATALHTVTFYTMLSLNDAIPLKICTYRHRKTAILSTEALPKRTDFLVFLH
jgi:hypothetical protein